MTTRLSNINLFVQNVERAVQFYVDVLGLTLDQERSVLPGFALLNAGESTLTLQDQSAPEAMLGQADSVEIGFIADDVSAIRQRFIDANIPVEDILQMGWGSGFNASDLDGHRLTIYQMQQGG